MKQLALMYPGARHFIVAHSHGGNVALYSLKDPDVDAIVSGILCFSTPFINISWRSDTRTVLYSRALRLVVGAPLTFLLIGAFLSLAPMDSLVYWVRMIARPNWGGAMFIAAIILVACFALIGPSLVVGPLIVRWIGVATTHADRLRAPDLADDRLLIIRTSADEASAAIAVSEFTKWVTATAYEALFAPILVLFDSLFSAFQESYSDRDPYAITLISPLLLLGSALLFVGGILVTIPICIVILLTAVGGVAYPSTALFLRASADTSPLGAHTVYNYDTGAAKGWLAHSASYSHPPAVDKAARWILR